MKISKSLNLPTKKILSLRSRLFRKLKLISKKSLKLYLSKRKDWQTILKTYSQRSRISYLRLMQTETNNWIKSSKQPSSFRPKEYRKLKIYLLHLLTPRNEVKVKIISQRMSHVVLYKHQLPC
jgi:hypothetical protein